MIVSNSLDHILYSNDELCNFSFLHVMRRNNETDACLNKFYLKQQH